MPAGRPTDYRPEYCQIVQDLGDKGYSVAEVAAHLNTTKPTLRSWSDNNPEFLSAMEIYRAKSQAWWEKLGREHVVENKDDDKINASLYSRSMAARFPDDWREKVAVGGDESAPPLGVKATVDMVVRPQVTREEWLKINGIE